MNHQKSAIRDSSVSGNDRRLDLPAAVEHVAQNLLQPRQWRFARDVVGGANFLRRDQAKGAPNRFRSVMECGFQRDLGIVQPVGLKLYLGPAGAAAKEIHRTALAD